MTEKSWTPQKGSNRNSNIMLRSKRCKLGVQKLEQRDIVDNYLVWVNFETNGNQRVTEPQIFVPKQHRIDA